MPELEQPPKEEFDWKNYDYAEDREGGSRDSISDLVIASVHESNKLRKRTFETSDMLNGGKVNTIILPENTHETEDKGSDF